jgi:hypothetical protein
LTQQTIVCYIETGGNMPTITSTDQHEQTPAGKAMTHPVTQKRDALAEVARRKSDAGLGISPEVEAHAAAKADRKRAGKAKTRTRSEKVAASKKAKTTKPVKKSTTTKLGHKKTGGWPSSDGREATVGARVLKPAAGVVRARCTKPGEPRIPMCGVELDDPTKYASAQKSNRAVKCPTFPASELVLAKK